MKILGNAYPGDLEDVSFKNITAIHVPTFTVCDDKNGNEIVNLTYRSQEEVNGGNIVILHGIDSTITHSATVIATCDDANGDEDSEELCFNSLHFQESVIKLSIEPLRPAELPKMVQVCLLDLKSYHFKSLFLT